MLAFSFMQQYHVLRCARLAGFDVHVLGRDLAGAIRLSRHCATYQSMRWSPGRSDLASAVAEINAIIKQRSIDLVMPSDLLSTRLLIAASDRLSAPCVPLPDAERFDELHDKWSFAQFCSRHRLPSPATRVFATVREARLAIETGAVALPVILKPTNKMASSGVVVVEDLADLHKIDDLSYRPVLVQRFVRGQNCGLAIVCRHGEVVASSFQRHFDGGYEYCDHAGATALARQFARATRFNGIVHFDMIEADLTGELCLLECNPRVWYSMFALAVSGQNFVAVNAAGHAGCFMPDVATPNRRVHVNTALLRRLLSWRKPARADLAMLRYYLSDPVPILCERMGLFKDYAPQSGWKGKGSLDEQVAAVMSLSEPVHEPA